MDISELSNFATSPPDVAAKNIDNAGIVNVDPSTYVDHKDNLEPVAENLKKPTEAAPIVADYMRQSPEHAALALPDVEHLSYIERQAKLISDYVTDRPTNDQRIVDLSLKKMADPGNFSKDDELSLYGLNLERGELAQRNYGLDGPIEQLPAKVIGGIAGFAKQTAQGAIEGAASPVGKVNPALGMIYGAAKKSYDILTGGTYNDTSNIIDPKTGQPLNIDEDTKRHIAQGVGVIGTAIQAVVPAVLGKTTPFLAKFLTPSIGKILVMDPTMAAVRVAVFNIGKSVTALGGAAGATEATKIIGEELAKHSDGSEASFLNALYEGRDRLASAALVGGASGLALSAPANILGFGTTKSTFARAQEAANQFENARPMNARDVTPQAPLALQEPPTGNAEPTPTDQTPPGEPPVVQANKVLLLKEAVSNINKAAKETGMNDLSPSELSSVKQKIFDGSGLGYVWTTIANMNKFINDIPARGEAARNIMDQSGAAANQMNTPFKVPTHQFTALTREYPDALDAMQASPEGPTPTQAEEYVKNINEAETRRQGILQRLGAGSLTPEDAASLHQALGQDVKNLHNNSPWPLNIDTAEADYMNAPTFTKEIEGVLGQAEIQKFNEAQTAARQSVLDSIKESAELEMNQVQNVELENQMEVQREIEFDRAATDPNVAIIDKFNRHVVANSQGKKSISIYAIDPSTLPDSLLKYADNPRLKELGVFHKGGGTAQDAARNLGVDTAENLMKILVNTPSSEQLTTARTEFYRASLAKQVKENVDLDRTNIAKATNNKSLNHLREMKFMRERKWPAAKGGFIRIALPLPRIEEFTQKAKSAVAQTTVGDLNVNQFKVGERQSQKIAIHAIVKNEVLKAYIAKGAAALNSEFQNETMKAISRVNRVFNFARRFNQADVMQELKDAGPLYENAANELLDAFNLNPSKKGLAEQGSFQKYVKAQVALGNTGVFIPERLSDLRQSANDMTVEAVELVGNRLKQLLYEAKNKNRLIGARDAKIESDTIELIAEKVKAQLEAHPDFNSRKLPSVQDESRPPGEQIRAALSTAESLFNNLEHIVLTLDEEKLAGYMHSLLVKPIKGDGELNGIAGESGVSKDLHAFKEHFEKLIEKYGEKEYQTIRNTSITIPEFNGLERLGKGQLTKGELIVMALNRGDPDGIENLKNLGASLDVIDSVLERELTAKDVDFAQSIVDMIGSYKDRSAALQKRDTGEDVTFIQGVPWTHGGITRPGGYWPQRYVTDFNAKKIKDTLKDRTAALFGGKEPEFYARQYAAEMTNQNRYEDRVGSNQALDLSMFGIPRSFEEVIHDLNYREVVKNGLKLLKNPVIKNSIIKTIGLQKYGVMVSVYVEAAGRITAENQNYFSDQNRFMKAVINNPSAAQSVGLLAYNVSSILVQSVSLLNTMEKMGGIDGPKHVINVMRKMAMYPHLIKGYIDHAAELNPSVRDHMANIENKMASTVHDLLPQKNLHSSLSPVRRFQQFIIHTGMEGMGQMDQLIKVIGTLAANEHLLSGKVENVPFKLLANMTHAERFQAGADYSRQISRTTLTHGQETDKSAFQKIPIINTFFAKFWNDLRNYFNLSLSKARRIKWKLQDLNEGLGQGHDIPNAKLASSGAKGAAALMTSSILYATIYKLAEDRIRGRKGWGNPWDQNFDLSTDKGLKDAGIYMAKYMLSAPFELFFESIPIVRSEKYAADTPINRRDYKDVQEPFQKIQSDIATTYNAGYDYLVIAGKHGFSKQQVRAALNTLGYLTGGIPVGGPYKIAAFLKSNETVKAMLGKGSAQKLAEEIERFNTDPPKGTTAEFKSQLEDLSAQLTGPPSPASSIPAEASKVIAIAQNGNDWTKPALSEGQWKDLMAKAPELGLTENGRVSKDSTQRTRAQDWSNSNNAQQLVAKNIPVSTESLWGAQKLGMNNYAQLYKATADTKIKAVLDQSVLNENPDIAKFKTVGQVKKYINDHVVEAKKQYENLTLSTANTED